MKYYIQNNVGKAKYVVTFHDGIKKHDDGSEFWDIRIFKSKKKMQNFIKYVLSGDWFPERSISDREKWFTA